jgi:glyoxylase-like metal-dependent hydrolase (beta-lactamase superfamily II)
MNYVGHKILLIFVSVISTIDAQPKCSAAPLPQTASFKTNLPGKQFFYERLGTTNAYWLTSSGVCLMFVVTNAGVVVFDAPPGYTNFTLQAIREVTTQPVTYMVYSHSHADHTEDAYLYGNVQRIGTTDTLNQLILSNDPFRPIPTITFSNSLTMNIGGTNFQFDYRGPVHKIGNMITWLPDLKVLYQADMINPGWVPFPRLALAPEQRVTLQSMDTLLSYPFDYLVPGHVGRLGTREDLTTMKEYLRDIQTAGITAINEIPWDMISARVQDQSNIALITVEQHKARVARCAQLVTPKWVSRLGGADAYTPSNCDTVMWAQQVDIRRSGIPFVL